MEQGQQGGKGRNHGPSASRKPRSLVGWREVRFGGSWAASKEVQPPLPPPFLTGIPCRE